MIADLIHKIDELAGTDDFEDDLEEIMDRIRAEGAGFEIVDDLLRIMEKHKPHGKALCERLQEVKP